MTLLFSSTEVIDTVHREGNLNQSGTLRRKTREKTLCWDMSHTTRLDTTEQDKSCCVSGIWALNTNRADIYRPQY